MHLSGAPHTTRLRHTIAIALRQTATRTLADPKCQSRAPPRPLSSSYACDARAHSLGSLSLSLPVSIDRVRPVAAAPLPPTAGAAPPPSDLLRKAGPLTLYIAGSSHSLSTPYAMRRAAPRATTRCCQRRTTPDHAASAALSLRGGGSLSLSLCATAEVSVCVRVRGAHSSSLGSPPMAVR